MDNRYIIIEISEISELKSLIINNKEDLINESNKLDKKISEVKNEINDVKTELKREINDVKN